MRYDKTEKGLYAPNYYNDFKCIADRCRHSCCIDWEICIDEKTFSKYKEIQNIMDSMTECEDGPCFALTENGRCPHLNDNGLCNIILSHGEDFLSDICRNHPRFFHAGNVGRTEVGLGIVCEEACRLILENDTPFSLSKIAESYDEMLCDADFPVDFNPFPQREQIFSIIEAPEGGFDEKIGILKDIFKIFDIYTAEEWIQRFLTLEILDADWEHTLRSAKGKGFRKRSANTEPYEKYYTRLLTYFVYRHVSLAESADNLRARLAFAILSVEMIRYLFEEGCELRPEALIEIARRYSAEIEYSEDNTFELIFEFESKI